MTPMTKPWHGILVATALPMRPDARGELQPDFDAYADHVRWLAANGCHGVVPNGSLGEYQTLSAADRARVVTTAVEASPAGFTVMPGVAAYGADEARRWAEQAAEAGAQCVMLLPPNSYRADPRAVVAHYREVAKAGLPIMAYNNPFDTKVDLVPELLAELWHEGLIVAVKEFSGDVRRIYQVNELAPGLDVVCGSDDVVLELAIAGAPGWVAGYPNALPPRLRGPVGRGDRARPRHRPAALPPAAPAAPLGLEDRVRAGDQAVDGPRRAGTAARAARRASRSPRSRTPGCAATRRPRSRPGWRPERIPAGVA